MCSDMASLGPTWCYKKTQKYSPKSVRAIIYTAGIKGDISYLISQKA